MNITRNPSVRFVLSQVKQAQTRLDQLLEVKRDTPSMRLKIGEMREEIRELLKKLPEGTLPLDKLMAEETSHKSGVKASPKTQAAPAPAAPPGKTSKQAASFKSGKNRVSLTKLAKDRKTLTTIEE